MKIIDGLKLKEEKSFEAEKLRMKQALRQENKMENMRTLTTQEPTAVKVPVKRTAIKQESLKEYTPVNMTITPKLCLNGTTPNAPTLASKGIAASWDKIRHSTTIKLSESPARQ
jgi:hypothetical protein